MKPAFGVDPGGYSGLHSCRVLGGRELLEFANGDSSVPLPLPSVVLRSERGEPTFELEYPLLALGTGAAWPPEAQVSAECGSRRIPLALALALLQSGRQLWVWPTFGVGSGPQRDQGQLGQLLREGIEAKSKSLGGPIAVPVSGLLPIEVQTELSSRRYHATHSAEEVRLLWRSMAIAIGMLGPWDGFEQVGTLRSHTSAQVLHIHLGIDGFEANLLSIQSGTGQAGPQLLVPARKRPVVGGDPAASEGVTACVAPEIGIRLLCAALRAKGAGTIQQLWEAAFTLHEAQVVPDSSDYSHNGKDKLQWSKLFEPVDINGEIDKWISQLSNVIACARNARISAVILSGQYSKVDWWASPYVPRLANEMRRVLSGLGVPTQLAPQGAVSAGAALFASRRARGWATYLDELPAVEMVVQRANGPGWTYAIKPQTFYDAGKPAFQRFDNFGRLSAGANKLLLPALVEGFGSVREASIEFDRPTESVQSVDLETEMEAASGLPVIRAKLPNLEGRAAELNWATSSDTHLSKQGYLDALPQQFPPLEIRVESKWWVNGQSQTRVQFSGKWLTCDEACKVVAAESRKARLEEYFKLLGDRALKREWVGSGNQRRLEAATDSCGRNRWSDHLESAQDRAIEIVANASNTTDLWKYAARFLANTRSCSPKTERIVTARLDELRVCRENDQLLAMAGNCVQSSTGCNAVLGVLSRRVSDYVDTAQLERAAPIGINTMKAISSLLSSRPDATSDLENTAAKRLAEGATRFLELGVAHADAETGLHQRYRAGIKAVVFLLRRRAYDTSYMGESTKEFSRAIRSCCIAGLVSQMRQGLRGLEGARLAFQRRLGLDSELASDATKRTRRVLKSLGEEDIPRPLPHANDPQSLDLLVEQVVRYIEGRGAGIIVIPD